MNPSNGNTAAAIGFVPPILARQALESFRTELQRWASGSFTPNSLPETLRGLYQSIAKSGPASDAKKAFIAELKKAINSPERQKDRPEFAPIYHKHLQRLIGGSAKPEGSDDQITEEDHRDVGILTEGLSHFSEKASQFESFVVRNRPIVEKVEKFADVAGNILFPATLLAYGLLLPVVTAPFAGAALLVLNPLSTIVGGIGTAAKLIRLRIDWVTATSKEDRDKVLQELGKEGISTLLSKVGGKVLGKVGSKVGGKVSGKVVKALRKMRLEGKTGSFKQKLATKLLARRDLFQKSLKQSSRFFKRWQGKANKYTQIAQSKMSSKVGKALKGATKGAAQAVKFASSLVKRGTKAVGSAIGKTWRSVTNRVDKLSKSSGFLSKTVGKALKKSMALVEKGTKFAGEILATTGRILGIIKALGKSFFGLVAKLTGSLFRFISKPLTEVPSPSEFILEGVEDALGEMHDKMADLAAEFEPLKNLYRWVGEKMVWTADKVAEGTINTVKYGIAQADKVVTPTVRFTQNIANKTWQGAKAGANAVKRGFQTVKEGIQEGAEAAWDWTKEKAIQGFGAAKNLGLSIGQWAIDKAKTIRDGTSAVLRQPLIRETFVTSLWNPIARKQALIGATTGIGSALLYSFVPKAKPETLPDSPIPVGDGDFSGFYHISEDGTVIRTMLSEGEYLEKLASGSALFINGVLNNLADHSTSAKALAKKHKRGVIGLYNQSQGAADFLQFGSDKGGDLGRILGKGNPAIARLRSVMHTVGPKLTIYAHSQGSQIVSEALWQEVGDKRSLSKDLKIVTFGNAAEAWPVGPQVSHYVNNWDYVSLAVGTRSPNASMGLVPELVRKGLAQDPRTTTTFLPNDRKFYQGHDLSAYIERLPEYEDAERRRGRLPAASRERLIIDPKPMHREPKDGKPGPDGTIQRKGSGPKKKSQIGEIAARLESYARPRPLGTAAKQLIGRHLGIDPDGIGIGEGSEVSKIARDLGADAFAIGGKIFFGEGKFDPKSPGGLGLIAHEMTHVLQQSQGRARGKLAGAAYNALEQEADTVQSSVQTLSEPATLEVGRTEIIAEYDDGSAPEPDFQERLQSALQVAIRTVKQREGARLGGQSIDSLELDVSLSGAEASDAEMVQSFVGALTAAIRKQASGAVGGLLRPRRISGLAPGSLQLKPKNGAPKPMVSKVGAVNPRVLATTAKAKPSHPKVEPPKVKRPVAPPKPKPAPSVGRDVLLGEEFVVPRNQLAFNEEGLEAPVTNDKQLPNRLHTRKSHVPLAGSGVTLGRGYDMKLRTQSDVLNQLKAAGVPDEQAQRLSKGAGRRTREEMIADLVTQGVDPATAKKAKLTDDGLTVKSGKNVFKAPINRPEIDTDAKRREFAKGVSDIEISPAAQKMLFIQVMDEKRKESLGVVERALNRRQKGKKEAKKVQLNQLDPSVEDAISEIGYVGWGDSKGAPKFAETFEESLTNNDTVGFHITNMNRSAVTSTESTTHKGRFYQRKFESLAWLERQTDETLKGRITREQLAESRKQLEDEEAKALGSSSKGNSTKRQLLEDQRAKATNSATGGTN